MIAERIGPVTYDKPFSWRVRLALWIAPELKVEIAHWAEQARLMSYLKEGMDVR